MAQTVKNLPAMQEIRFNPRVRKMPLEEEMPRLNTYSSILAYRIPWTEEPCGHSPWGLKKSWIQYSCLQNSMDRGALWAQSMGSQKELDMTEQITLSHTGINLSFLISFWWPKVVKEGVAWEPQ